MSLYSLLLGKHGLAATIDTETRTAFAVCYTNHGSCSATDFLSKVMQIIPDCPRALQTDNGSEFAPSFQESVKKEHLLHFHMYPRTPKMNAHVERFNRTLDEEFLKYHKTLMRDDISAFNNKLADWLVWYNAEKPHSSLGQKAPLQVMMAGVNPKECQMWRTRTSDVPVFNRYEIRKRKRKGSKSRGFFPETSLLRAERKPKWGNSIPPEK